MGGADFLHPAGNVTKINFSDMSHTLELPGSGAPLRRWIQEDLVEVVPYLLGPGQLRARGLIDPGFVERMLDANTSGRADHAYPIYALLNLESWMQTFLDRPGVEVTL